MYISRKTKVLIFLCLMPMVLAGLIRLTRNDFPQTECNMLLFMIFMPAGFLWMVSVETRVLQPEERKYLILTIASVLLLMGIRTVKFIFIPRTSTAARYVWYLYYFLQTFAVLFLLLAVVHIGKAYDTKIDSKWKLLYIPAFIISAGVFLNDFHQKAFFFTEGLENWEDHYVHGPVYFLSLLWMVLMFGMALVITIKKCTSKENRKNIWIPFLPLAVGGVYTVFFLADPDGILSRLYKTTDVICFVILAFMEGLIQARLFPSNDCYDEMWKESDICGGIVDSQGRILCRSEKEIAVTLEEIKKAAHRSLLIENQDYLLRSKKLEEGYVYWFRDMKKINNINQQLEETGNIIAEENKMLEGENRLAEKQERIRQQNIIYDCVYEKISGRLEELDYLVDHLPKEEKTAEEKMKYGAFLMAYVKRCSNLVLHVHQDHKVSTGEICLAIEESLNYVRLWGVKAFFSMESDCDIGGKAALLLYEFFQSVMELFWEETDTLLIILECGRQLRFYMELGGTKKGLPEQFMEKELTEVSGRLVNEREGNIEFITLQIPSDGIQEKK